jgi:hypothetical protein
MRTQIRPTSINITSESSVVTTNVDPVADPTAPTNTLAVCRLPNDSVTTSNTTDFVDGGSKVCVESTSDTATLYTDTSPNFYLSDQNLIDYFGKPHQCATWTWDTQVALAVLGTLSVPRDIFSGNVPMQNRLTYWHAFRGDVVIRIVSNPAMSQSGKVLFIFKPFDSLKAPDYVTRMLSLMSVTQFPKVEFDLATDRTAEMRIPYRMVSSYFPATTLLNWQDYGSLQAVVYTPLRGGGSVNFNVYAYFDTSTVVLANPTTAVRSVLLQSGRLTAKSPPAASSSSKINKVEEKEKQRLPVSKILSTVSKVASTVAAVPILADIAGPVAWAANVASGVAAAFGWSNPRTQTVPEMMLNRDARDMCTVDQAVPGFTYAFTGASSLSASPAAGFSQEDELHFGHLLPLSTHWKTFTWSDTATTQTALVPITSVDQSLGTVTASGFIHSTPWRAISSLFAQWRGVIRLTIKVAKSRFHTGRLLIAYDSDPVVGNITYALTDVLPRLIIDLESGNEWTFEFPFSQPEPYIEFGQSNGRFIVYILTPLRAAGGASSTVDVVCETSMRADASFAYPLGTNRVQLQSGGTLPDDVESERGLTNMSLTPFTDPALLEASCSGDFCRSLRSYIKRGSYTRIVAGTAYAFIANYPFNRVTVGGIYTAPVLANVASWYAKVRGSIRLTVFSPKPMIVILGTPQVPGALATDTDTGFFQYIKSNTGCDLEVPQMYYTPWRVCTPQNIPGDPHFRYPILIASLPDFTSIGTFLCSSSAADDFDLSMFVGITPTPAPPLALGSSNSKHD